MNIEDWHREGRTLGIGFGVSVGLHVFLVGLLSFLVWSRSSTVAEPEEGEESIEVVLEEPEPPRDEDSLAVPLLERLPIKELVKVEEEEPEPNQDEKDEDESEVSEVQDPSKPPEESLYAVEQLTNARVPEEADHISDQANRVEEETIAEVRTFEEVELTREVLEAPEVVSQSEFQLAMILSEEREELPDEIVALADHVANDAEEVEDVPQEEIESAEVSEEVLEELREYRDPSEMIVEVDEEGEESVVEPLGRERLFARDRETARALREEIGQRLETLPQGRRILSRWEERSEVLRASLENHLSHVQVGNHTAVNAIAAPHASYLARMHRTIHQHWAMGFIPRVQDRHGNAHPLNVMTLHTVVEIVIDAEAGEVAETNIVSGSGNTVFDAEALLVSRKVGALRQAPEAMVSPDGRVYVHWSFWRDMRQCGTFGARIFRLQDQDERRAVP